MEITAMTADHAEEVVAMIRTFFASPAVSTNGTEDIFRRNVENCVNGSPYIEGYVFMEGDTVLGYSMAAKSYSTEFGKNCIWLEDIYLKPEHRGKGVGSAFLAFMRQKYPDALLRLEVEEENAGAVRLYRENGFDFLPYLEMKR